MGYRNLKPTTPEEWSVIVWTGVVLLSAMAAAAFLFVSRAETAEQAAQLKSIGFWSAGLAIGLIVIRQFVPNRRS